MHDLCVGKILTLVQEAQSSRPAIQEVADCVASYFVPSVAMISLVTFVSWIIAFETGNVAPQWLGDTEVDRSRLAYIRA